MCCFTYYIMLYIYIYICILCVVLNIIYHVYVYIHDICKYWITCSIYIWIVSITPTGISVCTLLFVFCAWRVSCSRYCERQVVEDWLYCGYSNVINHPSLIMVIRGMVYYCYTNIIEKATSSVCSIILAPIGLSWGIWLVNFDQHVGSISISTYQNKSQHEYLWFTAGLFL